MWKYFLTVLLAVLLTGTLSQAEIKYTRGVSFCDRGNRKLQLDIFQPEQSSGKLKPYVLIHGGGWVSGQRWLEHENGRMIAEDGGFAVAMSYRLANGKSHGIQEQLDDIQCAITWIKENADRYGLDSTQITTVGHSAGGHLSLLSAFSFNDPDITHAVSMSGPTDFPSWAKRCDSSLACGLFKTVMKLALPGEEQNPELLEKYSPISWIAKRTSPMDVQILHGDHDSLVPLWHSETFCDASNSQGYECQLTISRGADHLLANRKVRRAFWANVFND